MHLFIETIDAFFFQETKWRQSGLIKNKNKKTL